MLAQFEFEGNELRFVDGKPVANDVAAILGYKDPSDAVYRLVKVKNSSVGKIQTVDGKMRDVKVLEEAGIYQLIFSCKLPIAEKFQDWVFEEVLPSIRKTGSYSVNQQPQLPSRQVAIETAEAVNQIKNLLSDTDPRLAQFLIDYAISDIMPNQQTLTGDRLRGVTEIAVDLGYLVDIKNRGQLGKFVKQTCEHLAQSEERLVNGQNRKVACYPEQHPEVIAAIHQFFS